MTKPEIYTTITNATTPAIYPHSAHTPTPDRDESREFTRSGNPDTHAGGVKSGHRLANQTEMLVPRLIQNSAITS